MAAYDSYQLEYEAGSGVMVGELAAEMQAVFEIDETAATVVVESMSQVVEESSQGVAECSRSRQVVVGARHERNSAVEHGIGG